MQSIFRDVFHYWFKKEVEKHSQKVFDIPHNMIKSIRAIHWPRDYTASSPTGNCSWITNCQTSIRRSRLEEGKLVVWNEPIHVWFDRRDGQVISSIGGCLGGVHSLLQRQTSLWLRTFFSNHHGWPVTLETSPSSWRSQEVHLLAFLLLLLLRPQEGIHQILHVVYTHDDYTTVIAVMSSPLICTNDISYLTSLLNRKLYTLIDSQFIVISIPDFP